jgi:hypothetical protein
MAITAGNAAYVGQGPTQSGQIIAAVYGGPSEAQTLHGTATVTGDAASSTFDVNFIDGTKTINFTPTLILCNRIGGAATATISVVSAVPVDNKKFTVNTSANVNAATFIVGFIAIP